MEEYRAWVVDRVVIKLRSRLESAKEFDSSIKKAISDEIYKPWLQGTPITRRK